MSAPLLNPLEKAIFLQGTAVFHDAPSESLNAIGALARQVEVPAGGVIFREDDPADAFYVLVSGRVRYARRGQEVRSRGPGEVLGLWSAFDGELRLATATAAEDVRLLKIAYEDFQDLVLDSMDLGRGIYRVLAGEIGEAIA